METIAVYITAKDATQARFLGRTLVEERLAACVNIFNPVQSIYRWDGAICEDTEATLIVKTRPALLAMLVRRVKELHSYSCPCVVALPIVGGNDDFIRWIATETGG